MHSPAFSHIFAISHYCFYIKLGCEACVSEERSLQPFLKIAQTASQKCSSEHWLRCMMKTQRAWSGRFYHFSDGRRWTHIHLSSGIQCHFDNNQNDCFSQLVTYNTLPFPLPTSEVGTFQNSLGQATSLYHPHPFPKLWPLPGSGCGVTVRQHLFPPPGLSTEDRPQTEVLSRCCVNVCLCQQPPQYHYSVKSKPQRNVGGIV